MALLVRWNDSCQPPWTEHELEHKLREAETAPFDKPRGYLVSKGTKPSTRSARPAPTWKPDLPTMDYDLGEAEKTQLPKGKRNGFQQLLEACFRPGEGVRVMSGVDDEGLIRCDSKGGVVLSQEEWLKKLHDKGGINGIYTRMGGPPVGVYLGVNPMQQDGRGRDSDVSDFRHVLLEFDEISLNEQWLLFVQSNLPCAAVIYSGNKSLHAWVKVNALNRKEYDERANLVYNHFKAYKPDLKNKNPSRFSRCPDAFRGNTQQMLLALDIGAASFIEWSKHLLVQGIGQTYTSDEILDYSPSDDNMTIVGNNYLRRGGSCILVGPSGIGKSSLGLQIAITWALGLPCFGMTPVKPLKVLLIEAENDISDMHDMGIGIARAMSFDNDPEKRALLRQNLITNHNLADTGHDFILSMQRQIDYHEPDLVMADPLLSFISDDISRQEVVGKFCRNWLNPVLAACNVAFMGIHHTGKPAQQKDGGKARKPQIKSLSDWAYQGIGSSELTNWARAIMVLNPVEEHRYDLILAKRGKRASATHPNGMGTNIVHLEHSREDIFWLQTDPPEEVASATHSAPRVEKALTQGQKAQVFATGNLHDLLAKLPSEGIKHKELAVIVTDYAANTMGIDLGDARAGTVSRTISMMLENQKLAKTSGLYIPGPNA